MNYYDALQINEGPMKGRWHYVSRNRRSGTHPVGYCSRYRDCPNDCFNKVESCGECENGVIKLSDEEYHAHAHETADEAKECFRRYLLDGIREEDYGDWTGCVVCDKPTKKGLTTRPPLGTGYALCDEHRTHEQIEKLSGPVDQIMASY